MTRNQEQPTTYAAVQAAATKAAEAEAFARFAAQLAAEAAAATPRTTPAKAEAWDAGTYRVGDTPCDCTEPASTYLVPPRFFHDHANRGCLGHEVHGVERGKLLAVDLRPCDVAELLSDARHYATSASDYGSDFFGLCASARATVKRLAKAVTA